MTERYKLQFNKAYLKDLEKIPKKDQGRIRTSVSELSNNPRPEGCKRLQGQKDPPLYRIRCGDYRIIYTIQDNILLILVVAVGHRREIYR